MSPFIARPYAVWTAWIAVAVLLQFGPKAVPQLLESVTIQVAALGLQVVPSQSEHTATEPTTQNEVEQLRANERILIARVATLQTQLQQVQSVPTNILSPESSLVSAKGLSARVLGARGDAADSNIELLIALGKQQGLVGEELVLQGPGVLIDQGEIAGLVPDQLVSEGRVLFGRIHRLGRLSSLVQPVHDPDFRIAVRLVRNSAIGPVWGATGILTGTGSGCEIHEISATEPVAIGDFIYTQPQLSTSSEMIYCGQVKEATVEPTDTHWEIQVTTARPHDELPSELFIIQSQLKLE